MISPIIANAVAPYEMELGVTRFPDQYNIKIKYTQVGNKNIRTNLQAAVNSWNSSDAQVLFTLNSTSPNIYLTSGTYGTTGWDGLCYYPMLINGNVGSIKINGSYPNSVNGNETECVAHELGHAIGLPHISTDASPSTLMRASGYKHSSSPSPYDIDSVNSFY